MNSIIKVDLFVEDRAHEEFLKAMIARIGGEANKQLDVRVRSGRGGHGRALAEFDIYQKSIMKDPNIMMGQPDILFVAIDSNCKRYNVARKEIESKIDLQFVNKTVIACPDPHIEKWYLADLDAFESAIGFRPTLGRKKCQRDKYKKLMSNAVRQAGFPPTLSGIEFTHEIVRDMDFFKAGKSEKSLKHFLDAAILHIRNA